RDWSSDVCSSDLQHAARTPRGKRVNHLCSLVDWLTMRAVRAFAVEGCSAAVLRVLRKGPCRLPQYLQSASRQRFTADPAEPGGVRVCAYGTGGSKDRDGSATARSDGISHDYETVTTSPARVALAF